ncbi:MAG: hypothetical protein FOGNACKC_00454 [Anaerolineae bacterium]|nr:hypothetical protein [Anaerolineae bacterium]
MIPAPVLKTLRQESKTAVLDSIFTRPPGRLRTVGLQARPTDS